MSQIIGHISQVIGPVVDVYFEGTDAELMLPSIHDALEIKRSNGKTLIISRNKSLPSRVRSPTPANTEKPCCFLAMLLMSSWISTVLPTPAPPNKPILPPLL